MVTVTCTAEYDVMGDVTETITTTEPAPTTDATKTTAATPTEVDPVTEASPIQSTQTVQLSTIAEQSSTAPSMKIGSSEAPSFTTTPTSESNISTTERVVSTSAPNAAVKVETTSVGLSLEATTNKQEQSEPMPEVSTTNAPLAVEKATALDILANDTQLDNQTFDSNISIDTLSTTTIDQPSLVDLTVQDMNSATVDLNLPVHVEMLNETEMSNETIINNDTNVADSLSPNTSSIDISFVEPNSPSLDVNLDLQLTNQEAALTFETPASVTDMNNTYFDNLTNTQDFDFNMLSNTSNQAFDPVFNADNDTYTPDVLYMTSKPVMDVEPVSSTTESPLVTDQVLAVDSMTGNAAVIINANGLDQSNNTAYTENAGVNTIEKMDAGVNFQMNNAMSFNSFGSMDLAPTQNPIPVTQPAFEFQANSFGVDFSAYVTEPPAVAANTELVQSTKQSSQVGVDQTTQQSTERMTEQPSEQTTQQSIEQTTQQSIEQTTHRSSEQTTHRSSEQTTQNITEQTTQNLNHVPTEANIMFGFNPQSGLNVQGNLVVESTTTIDPVFFRPDTVVGSVDNRLVASPAMTTSTQTQSPARNSMETTTQGQQNVDMSFENLSADVMPMTEEQGIDTKSQQSADLTTVSSDITTSAAQSVQASETNVHSMTTESIPSPTTVRPHTFDFGSVTHSFKFATDHMDLQSGFESNFNMGMETQTRTAATEPSLQETQFVMNNFNTAAQQPNTVTEANRANDISTTQRPIVHNAFGTEPRPVDEFVVHRAASFQESGNLMSSLLDSATEPSLQEAPFIMNNFDTAAQQPNTITEARRTTEISTTEPPIVHNAFGTEPRPVDEFAVHRASSFQESGNLMSSLLDSVTEPNLQGTQFIMNNFDTAAQQPNAITEANTTVEIPTERPIVHDTFVTEPRPVDEFVVSRQASFQESGNLMSSLWDTAKSINEQTTVATPASNEDPMLANMQDPGSLMSNLFNSANIGETSITGNDGSGLNDVTTTTEDPVLANIHEEIIVPQTNVDINANAIVEERGSVDVTSTISTGVETTLEDQTLHSTDVAHSQAEILATTQATEQTSETVTQSETAVDTTSADLPTTSNTENVVLTKDSTTSSASIDVSAKTQRTSTTSAAPSTNSVAETTTTTKPRRSQPVFVEEPAVVHDEGAGTAIGTVDVPNDTGSVAGVGGAKDSNTAPGEKNEGSFFDMTNDQYSKTIIPKYLAFYLA